MSRTHRFGHIEIRLGERALLIDGKPVALGARAFDVLQALMVHRDRIVTKNELLEMVWPGLVVEENNLQLQVSALRKLLGHQAVATIPGRGYQFTLSEDAISDSDASHTHERRKPTVIPAPRPNANAEAMASLNVAPATHSIAVLPFVNLSPDQDNGYFADGLAEQLLNVIAKVRGVRVAARTSSSTFKGIDTTIAGAGSALNVSTILEGSVRKSGNRVRVSVRLVKVDGEENLWSETYDRIVEDVFAVQDDITQSAVTAVREALLGEAVDGAAVKADVLAAARKRGGSADAHRLFLQGSFLVDRHSLPDMPKGIAFLREAVALDPGYALAWACLSRALALSAIYSHSPVEDVNIEARDAALRSLALEPDLAEGLMALGVSKMFGAWDWAGADAAFRRALEIAPDNADVLRTTGVLAHMLGRLDDALGLSRRAMERDPLGISGFSHFARTCRSLGKMADAERAYRRALELSPQAAGFHMALAWILLERGRADEALIEASLEPAPWARLCGEATVNFLLGQREKSDMAYCELVEKFSNNSSFQVALVHAVRGEIDAAFEWLERSFAQREFGLSLLMAEPHFRSLQADGRWFAFLKRLGLLM